MSEDLTQEQLRALANEISGARPHETEEQLIARLTRVEEAEGDD
jgi:hypothetical protein